MCGLIAGPASTATGKTASGRTAALAAGLFVGAMAGAVAASAAAGSAVAPMRMAFGSGPLTGPGSFAQAAAMPRPTSAAPLVSSDKRLLR